ncbi:D-amino acid dehydrogenase [Ferrovibrio xuzhouensis]|uniref:D-amino acid dehydrogenase n=1 Tax=Ferrovibrio xuzhouensis TaxID=1576914 RepID=A0ABV7VFX5_9PROT
MHVIVVGAGVVGMTTAWFLHRAGHRVTVIDAASGPGLGTSRANGAQLSYSYVAPLAAPEVLPALPKYLFDRNSPMRFRPALDPEQWRWGLEFLLACTAGRAAATTRALLALAFHSRAQVHEAVAEGGLDFAYSRTGKLVVYSDDAGLEGAKRQMEFQRTLGCEQEVLDRAGCLAIEPAVEQFGPRIVGGIYTPSEEAGDCHLFCIALEGKLKAGNNPAEFRYGLPAERLVRDGSRIRGVATRDGMIEGDAVVLAAGMGARRLAAGLGIRLPIYPLKGYSLSLQVTDPAKVPQVSVTDSDRKIVYARLGNMLRAAGVADLVGEDLTLDPARLGQVERETREAFGAGVDFSDPQPWCGLRPATPTGLPILGRTRYDNLLLNCGHGALGFTLSMGAAQLVADLLDNRPTAIPLDPYSL